MTSRAINAFIIRSVHTLAYVKLGYSRKRELNSDFRLKIASSVNSPRDAPRPKIARQTVEPGLEGGLLAQLTSESGRLC